MRRAPSHPAPRTVAAAGHRRVPRVRRTCGGHRIHARVRVKRAERLAIVHYPDEGARHLEVINFQPGFGALQLRAAKGRLDIDEVKLFRAGDRSTPTAKAITGPDYVLFVVPAGRYDVRVQHAEHAGAPDTHWIVAVDVPADGTRLKLIPQP